MKKRYIWVICLLVIIVILAVIGLKKGTFGVDEDPIRVVLECQPVGINPDYDEDDPDNPKYIGNCNVLFKVAEDAWQSEDMPSFIRVSASYDFGDGVTYKAFSDACGDGNNCFAIDTSNSEGFTASFTPGQGETITNATMGILQVKLPDNAEPNDQFTLGLNPVEIGVGYDEGDMYEISPVSTSIAIKNNVATLSHLTVIGNRTESSVAEALGDDDIVHEADVPSDLASTDIEYTPTDSNATVSCSPGTVTTDNECSVTLHYGRNEFELIVTAEDGETTQKYLVIINREYVFDFDVYQDIYYMFEDEQEHKVIYTETDTDDQIIYKLSLYDNSVYYDIDDGTLYIRNNENDEEALEEIVLSRLGVGVLTVDHVGSDGMGSIIYLRAGGPLTYGDIQDSSYNVNLILSVGHSGAEHNIDSSARETIIENEHWLYVRYGGNMATFLREGAVYTFIINNVNPDEDPGETPGGDPGGTPGGTTSLTFDSPLYVVDTYNIIRNIPFGYTGTILSGKIHGATNISFAKSCANGAQSINNSTVLNTGACVIINTSNDTVKYTLSVIGDVTGDGALELNDVGTLYRYYLHYVRGFSDVMVDSLERYHLMSGDLDMDGEISLGEIGVLYREYYLPTRGVGGDD